MKARIILLECPGCGYREYEGWRQTGDKCPRCGDNRLEKVNQE